MSVIEFPVKPWYEKLSWERVQNVARLVGYDAEEAIESYHGGGGMNFIRPDDRQFYMTFLLTHIFCMMEEDDPPTRWEDLPEEVRDFYTEASRLEADDQRRRDQAISDSFKRHFALNI